MQHVRNYGSFLQAYALKNTLETMGHQCEFVDIEQGVQLPGLERNLSYLIAMAFQRYCNWAAAVSFVSRMKYAKIYRERFDMHYLVELGIHKHSFRRYDMVVIGSDEVFNLNQKVSYGFTTQLYGDVKNADAVMSYAGSFGTTTTDVIRHYGVGQQIADSLSKMKVISVRDINSMKVVKELTGKEPSFNIDPVLMFDWQKLVREPDEKDYIIVYSYPNRIKDKDEIDAIKTFAKAKRKKLISVCFYFPWCDKTVIPHPFEVLGYMKNADYIITDTFHGCVMAIKFNKQFIALVRDGNKQKMSSLLTQFGLEERICNSSNDLQKQIEKKIAYRPINNSIAIETEKSLAYLRNNLIK